MSMTTRWKFCFQNILIYFTLICSYCLLPTNGHRNSSVDSINKHIVSTSNHTYITLSIDKLLIKSPPEQCCTRKNVSNCEVCVYICKFRVYDANNRARTFIDHTFDCSIETIGKKIQIPLLRPLSAPKIEVKLEIFTQMNDQLVDGLALLSVENLEHEPESRILKINIEERYEIDFNVSLVCIDGFVGPYCNISCPTPKIGDHHRCSPAGKYCEPGYMGEDCSIPICTYGCAHGKCIGPNMCQCEFGWYGSRCQNCKPTSQCKNPFYDNRTKKCQCSTSRGSKNGASDTLAEDLSRLDREYGKKLEENNSTYLTLSVFIIVLLLICAFLLVFLIIVLIILNFNVKLPCKSFMTRKRKTQPTTKTSSVPNIIDL